MEHLKGKLLAWQGDLTASELKAADSGAPCVVWTGPRAAGAGQALGVHLQLASACSRLSPATRQAQQMVSTHTTAGKLTPGPAPTQPPDSGVLLGRLSPQVVIKTQTEYQLSPSDQPKKFPDLEAQKLACNHPEEGRRVTQPSRSRGAQWSVPRGVRAGETVRRRLQTMGAHALGRVGWGPLLARLLSGREMDRTPPGSEAFALL